MKSIIIQLTMIKIIQIDLKIFASDRWIASDPHPSESTAI